jgi:NADPH:quinone reductase-like Zn-dependent oxidoreductase
MKAAVYTKYGEPNVVLIKEVEKPIPHDNEVLVKGAYLTVVMSLTLLLQSAIVSITGKYKLISAISKMTTEELQFITQLVEKGELKPVIDCTYSLSNIQTAHKHAEGGHRKGNIIIQL